MAFTGQELGWALSCTLAGTEVPGRRLVGTGARSAIGSCQGRGRVALR